MSAEISERFDLKFTPEPMSGCWLWTACTSPQGYGLFHDRGSVTTAHRYAYEALVAPIPRGLTLDHLCRTRACVNPAHLEAVTHRENILRGNGASAKNARKSTCLAGHPFPPPGKNGARRCRLCATRSDRAWRARKKAA